MPLVLIFLAIALFFPAKIHADTVQIEPAYVDVSLKETDPQEQFEINITNKSKKDISLELSSLDFKQTDPYGAVSFLGKEVGSYSYALSSFLTFETNNIEVDPGEKRRVLVTVTNRQDLSPGGHYAAIIVRQRASLDNEKTVITPAVSALVYLVKQGGERYNLSFKGVDFPKVPIVFSYPSTYSIELQNDGNVHLIPYGRSDVTDIFGRLIHKGIINEQSIRVFPQARRYVPVYSKKVAFSLPISINRITISGRDSLDKTSFNYQDYFLYINPVTAPLILVGITILILKRKRRKSV